MFVVICIVTNLVAVALLWYKTVLRMAYYTYFKEGLGGKGISQVFTNLQRLVEFDDSLNYHTLIRVLTKERKTWYKDIDTGIWVIKSHNLEKGMQRVVRKETGHNRNI